MITEGRPALLHVSRTLGKKLVSNTDTSILDPTVILRSYHVHRLRPMRRILSASDDDGDMIPEKKARMSLRALKFSSSSLVAGLAEVIGLW